MPVSVEEYKVAQVYMIAKMSKQNTGHGEGIEVIENRPYGPDENDGLEDGAGAGSPEPGREKGMYTHKIYHIGSRLPGWVKAVAPTTALQVVEKAWNAYPYCRTVYTCPFLGDRFSISVTTRYSPDAGTQDNALELTDQQLKEREVDVVDIAFDAIDPAKYKAEEDPTIFYSTKTERGRLKKDWKNHTTPVMTSYKYCSVEFRYWGLQSRVESFIHKMALRDVFVLGHRQAFCWIDEWFGLSMEEVRDIEKQSEKELASLLAKTEDATDGAD